VRSSTNTTQKEINITCMTSWKRMGKLAAMASENLYNMKREDYKLGAILYTLCTHHQQQRGMVTSKTNQVALLSQPRRTYDRCVSSFFWHCRSIKGENRRVALGPRAGIPIFISDIAMKQEVVGFPQRSDRPTFLFRGERSSRDYALLLWCERRAKNETRVVRVFCAP
jgi:hypothetical protein